MVGHINQYVCGVEGVVGAMMFLHILIKTYIHNQTRDTYAVHEMLKLTAKFKVGLTHH